MIATWWVVGDSPVAQYIKSADVLDRLDARGRIRQTLVSSGSTRTSVEGENGNVEFVLGNKNGVSSNELLYDCPIGRIATMYSLRGTVVEVEFRGVVQSVRMNSREVRVSVET